MTQNSDRGDTGLHHLYCEGCESNPTYAQIGGDECLICHCTHVDGELDPLPVHGFDTMPDCWEFKTEVTHRVR